MVQWSARRRGARVAILLAGCGILWLGILTSRPPNTTEDSGGPTPSCRTDMEVNTLPPMSADNYTMVSDLFNYLTKPNSNTCHRLLRFGGMAKHAAEGLIDGHKFVCVDPEFSLLTTDDCLVYSFGISDDWSFDYDMESFGCAVFAFDPTTNHSAGYQNGSINFFKFGLGGQDGFVNNMDLRTLDTFTERLGHAGRTIHYLKMDVETSEWDVFRQQTDLGHDSVLYRNVEQLGVELHFPMQIHVDFYREAYRSLLGLQELGFWLFSSEPNVMSPRLTVPGWGDTWCAMEVVWLKSRCTDITQSRRRQDTRTVSAAQVTDFVRN